MKSWVTEFVSIVSMENPTYLYWNGFQKALSLKGNGMILKVQKRFLFNDIKFSKVQAPKIIQRQPSVWGGGHGANITLLTSYRWWRSYFTKEQEKQRDIFIFT
jgi:hypothetical protein